MNIDQANAQYYNPNSEANQSAVNLADNFDDFLTLLTTQLANQDPLSPTDTTEFTNQLVSFTQVEQSIATNQNLEALIQLQSITQQNNEATILISYLGREIGSNLNISSLKDGEASWNLDFGAAADEVTYEIYDDRGNKVYSLTDSDTTSAGEQVFSWDGTLNSGGQAPEGTYYLVATATTDGGSEVDVSFNFRGLATSVETVNGQPVLMVDGLPIGLGNITSVHTTDTGNDAA
ncbi:flagellar hook assembly protein FlgD [Sneathiella chinensis]|uniref:Basal-body rod modification protein FlgD n=1 Tax=Sneathiella chinensis TaxID=349750 RepID=A0ABQ5U122_9PROT|nr:flagellar hook assembly protein FlgD [Sneathiella chinensis]GLQ05854.1 basal-body rod modification protein FlgD [Sneathiella chinensis]